MHPSLFVWEAAAAWDASALPGGKQEAREEASPAVQQAPCNNETKSNLKIKRKPCPT